MKSKNNSISDLSIIGLRIQGWTCSVPELASYKFGVRFAYGTCAAVVLLGLVFQNVYFYYAGFAITVGGMIPPWHPVDYLYNGLIRHLFKKPAIPKRPPQSRFACSIAFVWMSSTLLCWHNDYYWIASALAGALVMQAGIVTFTDICFPSMIFNFLTSTKITTSDTDETNGITSQVKSRNVA
jgi:Domain of unknown function (DUF4395)